MNSQTSNNKKPTRTPCAHTTTYIWQEHGSCGRRMVPAGLLFGWRLNLIKQNQAKHSRLLHPPPSCRFPDPTDFPATFSQPISRLTMCSRPISRRPVPRSGNVPSRSHQEIVYLLPSFRVNRKASHQPVPFLLSRGKQTSTFLICTVPREDHIFFPPPAGRARRSNIPYRAESVDEDSKLN